MSESQWVKQGGTFSHKNACKEFGLKEEEIIDAIKAGKLQYRQNYAHGNPYFRVLRTEVEALAAELHRNEAVEDQEIKHKLRTLTREINSLKRKLASLEKQKVELLEIQKHRGQKHNNAIDSDFEKSAIFLCNAFLSFCTLIFFRQ